MHTATVREGGHGKRPPQVPQVPQVLLPARSRPWIRRAGSPPSYLCVIRLTVLVTRST